MIVIVCLDDAKGMLFHHRRQSRDGAVIERIQEICKGKKLWMHPYSCKLYGNLEGVKTEAAEDFLAKAHRGEACLVETERLAPFLGRIEEIIVFWWNRRYPADLYLDLDLSQWEKVKVQEFAGTSHEKITEERYKGDGKPL